MEGILQDKGFFFFGDDEGKPSPQRVTVGKGSVSKFSAASGLVLLGPSSSSVGSELCHYHPRWWRQRFGPYNIRFSFGGPQHPISPQGLVSRGEAGWPRCRRLQRLT